MKTRAVLFACTLLSGLGSTRAAEIVTMSNLTRQFTIETNIYDGGNAANGSNFVSCAVFDLPGTMASVISPSLVVSGYTITSTTFKGLPWASPYAWAYTNPNTWTALPGSTLYGLRFFIDLSTPIGKAMYANMLMAFETHALVSISIDYSSWISGVGYQIVDFISAQ